MGLRQYNRVAVEQKFNMDFIIRRKRRIHALNHCIGMKRDFYATLLLPYFEVHRHIKLN